MRLQRCLCLLALVAATASLGNAASSFKIDKICDSDSLAGKYLKRYLPWCEQANRVHVSNATDANLEAIVLGFPGVETVHNVVEGLEAMGHHVLHSTMDFATFPKYIKLFANEKDEELLTDIVKSGFTITTDSHMSVLWKQQIERFPDAKVILLMNDNDECWWDEWRDWHAAISPFYGWPLTMFFDAPNEAGGVHRKSLERLGRELFGDAHSKCLDPEQTDTLDLSVKRSCIAAMKRYNEQIIDAVPKERLLVLKKSAVTYSTVCGFLSEEECPRVPFPDSDETLKVWMSIRVISLLALILPIFVFTFFYKVVFPKIFAMMFKPVLEAAIAKNTYKGEEEQPTVRRRRIHEGER